MKTMNPRVLLPILGALILWLCAAPARADAPALFTYQGRVKESGAVVTGSRMIDIKICNAPTAGTCIDTGCQGVSVTSGLFRTTFTINGWDPTPANSYLEVAEGTLCASLTTLTPREMLTSSPYALYASSAMTLIPNTNAPGVTISTHVLLGGALQSKPGTGLLLWADRGTNNSAAQTRILVGEDGTGKDVPILDAQQQTGGGTYHRVVLHGEPNTGGGAGPVEEILQTGSESLGITANNVDSNNYITWELGGGNGNDLVFRSGVSYNPPRTTSGGEVMRIKGTGNVGIGTAGPAATLHVQNLVSNTFAVKVSSNDGATTMASLDAAGNLSVARGSVTASAFYGDGSHLTGIPGTLSGGVLNYVPVWTGFNMLGVSHLWDQNSPVVTTTMTVQGSAFSVGGSAFAVSGGNVGIGTTSPGNTLDVNGGTLFRSSSTWMGVGLPPVSAPGQGSIFYDSGANQFKFSQSGSPYIPFANPSNLVQKAGDVMNGELTISGSSLAITGGGIGIGTTNPVARLHMSSGTMLIDGNVTASNASGAGVLLQVTTPGDANFDRVSIVGPSNSSIQGVEIAQPIRSWRIAQNLGNFGDGRLQIYDGSLAAYRQVFMGSGDVQIGGADAQTNPAVTVKSGGSVGFWTVSPAIDFSLGNSANRTFGLETNATGAGNSLTVQAGNGAAGNFAGGALNINAGNGSGSAAGGTLNLNSGFAGTGGGSGGTIQLQAQNGAGNGAGGAIFAFAGTGPGMGNGGDVYIRSGAGANSGTNAPGSIQLQLMGGGSTAGWVDIRGFGGATPAGASHLRSTQNTPPSIAAPSSCGAGATAANAVATNTDMAGTLTITTGSPAPTGATCGDAMVTYLRPYATAPKAVILTGGAGFSSFASGGCFPMVASNSAASFSVRISCTGSILSASQAFTIYYLVIE